MISKKIHFFILFIFIILINKTISTIENNQKIFLASIPKCGTWLLNKCVSLLSGKEPAIWRLQQKGILRFNKAPANAVQLLTPSIEIFNRCVSELNPNSEFLIGHLVYSNEYEKFLIENNFKIIFIIRDPRDQLISRANYTNAFPGLQNLSFDNLLLGLIGANSSPGQKFQDLITSWVSYPFPSKFKAISNIRLFYLAFLPWMQSKICYTVHFEDLVGKKGGGSKKKQIKEILNIAKHINIGITRKKAKEIADSLFGDTMTFREGKVGSWKKSFSDKHKEAFKQVAGKLLINLGYEKDLNW